MQSLVGKIIFACPVRAQLVELTPFIVLEQSSFALTCIQARGGIHSVYCQTLQLQGPSRHEIVAWVDQPELIDSVALDLAKMLEDPDLHLSEGATAIAKITLDKVCQLRTKLLDQATFYDEDLGEAYGLEDDSEDEARAAGEAAAEAIAEREFDAAIGNLLETLIPSQTVVIRCRTPEEVEAAFNLLLGGRSGN
jgi:hypothetical protein